MRQPSLFVGGPDHGTLNDADWTMEYIDPVLVRRPRLFGETAFDIEHRRGTYRRRRFHLFGQVVNTMVEDTLGPGAEELDRLLVDALLSDRAKSALLKPPQ